nr:IS66 family insertion sequence hypothetical protein [Gammaproteobacteria bacterium]
MTTKRKVRAAEWAERVRAWQRSGLTAAEYGARQGIDGKQLQWWKWRLGAGAKKSGAKGSGERELRFVPARVVERARGETSRVEIVLTNGRVVRVTGRVEPETLAQVLRVAGAGGA